MLPGESVRLSRGPVLVLVLLAPFVGEFLLGNLSLAELPLGVILAPMYGFGALLVREVGRRRGGWRSMALLAVAYALIEEGPVDQLFWNPLYAGVDYVHGPTEVPGLGLSLSTVFEVIALHAVWSICVPIALTETIYPQLRDRLWLRKRGLVTVAGLYAVGAGLVFWGNYTEEDFLASPFQMGYAAVVIMAIVVLAVRASGASTVGQSLKVPRPATVATFALTATSAYWGVRLVARPSFDWVGVAVWCTCALVGVTRTTRWSKGQHWNAGVPQLG